MVAADCIYHKDSRPLLEALTCVSGPETQVCISEDRCSRLAAGLLGKANGKQCPWHSALPNLLLCLLECTASFPLSLSHAQVIWTPHLVPRTLQLFMGFQEHVTDAVEAFSDLAPQYFHCREVSRKTLRRLLPADQYRPDLHIVEMRLRLPGDAVSSFHIEAVRLASLFDRSSDDEEASSGSSSDEEEL